MLRGIDPAISADLLHVMMLMGHGDDLVICDVNHPAATIAAETTHGRLLSVTGCDIPRLARAVLSLFPLDTFVEAPVRRMLDVHDPARIHPVQEEMQRVCDAAAGHKVTIEPLERFAFYAAARTSFAIVRTSDPGPYGCFILTKGVL
jgi:L-fucose mutarotase